MVPTKITDDYYAILQVPHTATLEVITKSYRRLARTLHPDKNPNDKLGATASFQNLVRAYDTIKEPQKRREYDAQWVNIRDSQRTQQEAQKCQAEAAEAEQRRAAKEKANKQKEEKAREDRLQPLELLRSRYEGDIFEANRVVRRLVAELKRVQDQDDEELRKEREVNSWWTYVTSPIYGKPKETEQERQKRETERLQRLAQKSIKENDLTQKRAKLQSLSKALQDVTSKIAAVKKEGEDEARMQAVKRQEQLRKEQEARRRAEEEQRRKQQATWEELRNTLRNEQAARAAKEAREAEEAWEEFLRKAEVEKCKAEAEERERVAQVAKAAQKAKEARNNRFQPATSSHSQPHASASNKTVCRHDKFWPKVEGRNLCGTCHTFQRRFAFQCPGCSMIACANCRQTLRGERIRNN